jgi:hypothetical protein
MHFGPYFMDMINQNHIQNKEQLFSEMSIILKVLLFYPAGYNYLIIAQNLLANNMTRSSANIIKR